MHQAFALMSLIGMTRASNGSASVPQWQSPACTQCSPSAMDSGRPSEASIR